MIRNLPYLIKNLKAASHNNKPVELYSIILNNYSGKDYTELESIVNGNSGKEMYLSKNEKFQLKLNIIQNFESKYYYNNVMIKPLTNSLLKLSNNDVCPKVIKKDNFNVQIPTMIHSNLNCSNRSVFLTLKYT